MSASSFTTLPSERSESLDSVASQNNNNSSSRPGSVLGQKGPTGSILNQKNFILPKSGSFVMCVSMATFYGGPEGVAGLTEEDDFGQDNPFVKELGLNDKAKLEKRRTAIEDAASLAKRRAERGMIKSGSNNMSNNSSQVSGRHLEKQLSNTQFSPSQHRADFIKREKPSAKAFTPAILSALAEKADEDVSEFHSTLNSASKRKSASKWGFVKNLIVGKKSSNSKDMRQQAKKEEPMM